MKNLMIALMGLCLVVTLGIGVAVCLPYRLAVVYGTSMEPSYEEGSIILKKNGNYSPEVGDVIVFKCKHDGTEEVMMKRVVAIAGDVVTSRQGHLFVNGERIVEDYAEGYTYCEEVEVQDGEIYVLGDNRDDSLDSRSFGTLKVSKVQAKVIKVWN